MSNANENHPISEMCNTAGHLREHALFAAKQAHNNVARAQKTNTDIANLDIQRIFQQLRQMVELVGGTSVHAVETSQDYPLSALPEAAE